MELLSVCILATTIHPIFMQNIKENKLNIILIRLKLLLVKYQKEQMLLYWNGMGINSQNRIVGVLEKSKSAK